MAAHVVCPAVDTLPASLSVRWITEILREELGFHGCVFADDLTMGGAAGFGEIAARVELGVAAGCDVLPICNDRAAVVSALAQFKSAGLNPASQARLVRMRGRGEAPVGVTATPRWRDAVTRLAAHGATPALVLREGPE
jgi:beta-N-acetylhexosaminidase